MEILLRKQPPSTTASFYDRMRFLVEDNSVQSYATLSSFNTRWSACLALCLPVGGSMHAMLPELSLSLQYPLYLLKSVWKLFCNLLTILSFVVLLWTNFTLFCMRTYIQIFQYLIGYRLYSLCQLFDMLWSNWSCWLFCPICFVKFFLWSLLNFVKFCHSLWFVFVLCPTWGLIRFRSMMDFL